MILKMANQKKIKTRYLSNGPHSTGGFFHESFWFGKINDFLVSIGYQVSPEIHRPDSYHKGFFRILTWFWNVFKRANVQLVLTPARCALPALVRSFFSPVNVWVVFHSFNTQKLKSNRLLSWYYTLLFACLKKSKNAKLVCVAPYWQNYFNENCNIPLHKIVYLPNLFDPSDYTAFHIIPKERSIHLGMWSPKLHKIVFEIAGRLAHNGYVCFFTSNQDLVSFGAYGYHIAFCETAADYKNAVAKARFTLAFSAIPEGWGRVAHESCLLQTPIIGNDNTGQSDLITQANGFFANSVAEVLHIVASNSPYVPPLQFVDYYHVNKAFDFLKPHLNSI